jgi:hypothetical protein
MVSGKRVWTPRPDPAVTHPGRPGLRPHRHTPDHLHGWVFLQHQVWVDYWGNEHEIELMAGDYVANVILFCEAQPLGIALIVWAEIAYRVLLCRAGLGESPRPEILEIRQNEDGSLRARLHELPLLHALDDRLDSLSQDGQ